MSELWREDERRHVRLRVEFLERTTSLDPDRAEAVAWSELGYSHDGVAKRVDHTAATVENYLDSVVDEYGVTAVLARPASEISVKRPLGRTDENQTEVANV
jgi:hypothetical protein